MMIKVIQNKRIREFVPAIQLSCKVSVSPEFRRQCDELYTRLFGLRRPFLAHGGTYSAHPDNAAMLCEVGLERAEEIGAIFVRLKDADPIVLDGRTCEGDCNE